MQSAWPLSPQRGCFNRNHQSTADPFSSTQPTSGDVFRGMAAAASRDTSSSRMSPPKEVLIVTGATDVDREILVEPVLYWYPDIHTVDSES